MAQRRNRSGGVYVCVVSMASWLLLSETTQPLTRQVSQQSVDPCRTDSATAGREALGAKIEVTDPRWMDYSRMEGAVTLIGRTPHKLGCCTSHGRRQPAATVNDFSAGVSVLRRTPSLWVALPLEPVGCRQEKVASDCEKPRSRAPQFTHPASWYSSTLGLRSITDHREASYVVSSHSIAQQPTMWRHELAWCSTALQDATPQFLDLPGWRLAPARDPAQWSGRARKLENRLLLWMARR